MLGTYRSNNDALFKMLADLFTNVSYVFGYLYVLLDMKVSNVFAV